MSYLPECWSDDARMNVLFSDFRSSNVNPLDRRAKITFWSNCIKQWSSYSQSLVFTEDDIKSAFRRKGRLPRCLTTVVDEMANGGSLVKASDFIARTSSSSSSWMSWCVDVFVKKPVGYTWSTVSSWIFTPKQEPVSYINIELLKEKCNLLFEQHARKIKLGEVKNISTKQQLFNIYKNMFHSMRDLEMCLLQLQAEKKISVQQQGENNIVKFAISEIHSEKPQLTQSDIAILKLKESQEDLEKQIELHEQELVGCINEAKTYLKQGARSSAKSMLQKKKLIERKIDKKSKTLENIEVLLHQLEESSTNQQVFDALKFSTSAFKKEGMQAEEVEEMMADVQDTLEEYGEIQEALASNLQPDVEMMELENELQDLLEESSSVETNKPKLDDSLTSRLNRLRANEDLSFPEVPGESPQAIRIKQTQHF